MVIGFSDGGVILRDSGITATTQHSRSALHFGYWSYGRGRVSNLDGNHSASRHRMVRPLRFRRSHNAFGMGGTISAILIVNRSTGRAAGHLNKIAN